MAATIKTSNLDRLFSQYVRARAAWRCERCGAQPKRQGLHCSHIFSRRHKGIRWHPSNAVAHCYGCHSYLGGNPRLFNEWARNYLGADTLEAMRQESATVTNLTEQDRRDVADDLYRKVQALGEAPVCTGYGRKKAKKKAVSKKKVSSGTSQLKGTGRKLNSGKYKKLVSGETVKREDV